MNSGFTDDYIHENLMGLNAVLAARRAPERIGGTALDSSSWLAAFGALREPLSAT